MSRFFAQCTVVEEYSISNPVLATSQILRAVCRLAFLLLSIDRIVEPSRKQEASSTELRQAWSRLYQRSTNYSYLFNMTISQNPSAHGSTATLTTPSGYSTPRLSVLEEKTPASSSLSLGNGRRLPAPVKEDDYIVDFDGPDDPRNPQNWSTWKK
jgi:hypothetical protein